MAKVVINKNKSPVIFFMLFLMKCEYKQPQREVVLKISKKSKISESEVLRDKFRTIRSYCGLPIDGLNLSHSTLSHFFE